MTEIAMTPSPESSVAPSADTSREVARADAVFVGRNAGAAVHLAGLIDGAQLHTVGSPRKLPMDLWPDVDPAVVQEIWNRGVVVGFRAGQWARVPRFYRDTLATLQGQLERVGFAAMARSVGRSRSVAEGHPADVEDGREH